MAYAVSLFFDEETDRWIRQAWQAIEDAGVSSFLSRGPYHPHLTMAIFEWANVAHVREELTAIATGIDSFRVLFPSIGIFPGDEGVVFLAATMSETLFDLHQRLHQALYLHCRNPVSYYLPNIWNPHCSLARGLTPEQITSAVIPCRAMFRDTLEGSITAIGLVDTPAEVEVFRIAFTETGRQ